MSEYDFVEKPFLDQLSSLDWDDVIDQGQEIPSDPSNSFRSDFRQTALKNLFKTSVRKINLTDDGKEWLSDDQLERLYEKLTNHPGKGLIEANQDVLNLLYRAQVDRNHVTGDEWPDVKIIDFENPERNRFTAINQFRIDTPGTTKKFIIPDIVLFVNGLPLVVIECKIATPFTSNPMYEGFLQLMRYSNQREETQEAGLKEGEPRLFHSNQLLIRTTGEDADVGSITATDEEFWFAWKYIPEKYKAYEPPLGKERAQEILIQGLLAKDTLLDVIRTCTLFMDVGQQRVKVVPRYQQYRAVQKTIARLRAGKTPQERSGVIWHTQGSGKSLTMVFTIRKLRLLEDLKSYKVVMINDRTDLEEQLGDTMMLTGEPITTISNSEELKEKLASDTSNLNMVMVHKFLERDRGLPPEYLARVAEKPVTYKTYGQVNDSERILIMIDEAHRTQSGDLGNNLFEAFPNATRIAFTGTPLITDSHTKKTWERFGTYIDKYRFYDAIEDGATLEICYEGKTVDAEIDDKSAFDIKFADLFRHRSDAELLAIKKRYGTKGDIMEADARIKDIAEDLVDHYISNILPNGFKAQVVCHSKMAAVKYEKHINAAVKERLRQEQSKPDLPSDQAGLSEEDRKKYRDDELVNKIAFLQSAVVVSLEGTNEKGVITDARKRAKERKAVSNFKRPFNYQDPEKKNTGIAFLIVCDMLLTGFDAPVEQVMYLDKKVKEHTLLQTIARVNRVYKGKSRGYIIDYIGLANNLKEALAIYAGDDYEEVQGSLRDLSAEIPVLETRYQRLLNLFTGKGIKEIEEFVEQQIKSPKDDYLVLDRCIDLLSDIKVRADFEVYFKKFLQSMDIILPHSAANPFKIPAKRFGFILAQVRERYKDTSINISGAGEKVRKLINEHLISHGIDPKIPPVELTSPDFLAQIEKNRSPKAKASEMEHAIRKHCKIRFQEDPAFYGQLSEKLENLLEELKNDWDQLAIELATLAEQAWSGRKSGIDGLDALEAAFYDRIGQIAFKKNGIPTEHKEKLKELVHQMMDKIKPTIKIVGFWRKGAEVEKLKGDLSDIMYLSGVTEIENNCERIVTEVTSLAEVRHRDIVSR